MINDMMTREDGTGQRFPHGSPLPEEELRVSCNLDPLNFCLINRYPKNFSSNTACCNSQAVFQTREALLHTANHNSDRPSPPSLCLSLQDHLT